MRLTPERWKDSARCGYPCVFHENLCSYVKKLFEHLLAKEAEYDLIVVPDSCDAMRKLHAALHGTVDPGRLFFLDFPRQEGKSAERFYAGVLDRLRSYIQEHFEVTTAVDCWEEVPEAKTAEGEKNIGLIGSNIDSTVLFRTAEKLGVRLLGISRCTDRAFPDPAIVAAIRRRADLLELSGHYLRKNRCPRSHRPGRARDLALEIRKSRVSGVIFHTLKFCDFYPFEWIELRRELIDLPMLVLEHDLASTDEGQIMTRLSAFLESIFPRPSSSRPKDNGTGFFAGIDSGSHATKAVLVDTMGRTIAMEIVVTGTSVQKSAMEAFQKAMAAIHLRRSDVSRVVATGYGRSNVDFADECITEITCHAVGLYSLIGAQGTIIDIGGQDSKVIRLSKDGKVEKFAMNDKCAAGTGRFLEVIADRLGMSLEGFSSMAAQAKRATSVSSMCSVFAESEVISLIASGQPVESIAKGIHQAVASRTLSLVRRVEGIEPYYMTGGVARNRALVEELSRSLGTDIHVVAEPQMVGALGAAILAAESVS